MEVHEKDVYVCVHFQNHTFWYNCLIAIYS